jgi:hypothetical protein
MPFAAEVHALQAEIGGQQQLMPARRTQHSAIVTNSACQHSIGFCSSQTPDAFNQLSFG